MATGRVIADDPKSALKGQGVQSPMTRAWWSPDNSKLRLSTSQGTDEEVALF